MSTNPEAGTTDAAIDDAVASIRATHDDTSPRPTDAEDDREAASSTDTENAEPR